MGTKQTAKQREQRTLTIEDKKRRVNQAQYKHFDRVTYLQTRNAAKSHAAETTKGVYSHSAETRQQVIAAQKQAQLDVIQERANSRPKESSQILPTNTTGATQKIQSSNYTLMGGIFRAVTIFIVMALIYKMVATPRNNPGSTGAKLIGKFGSGLKAFTVANNGIFVSK